MQKGFLPIFAIIIGLLIVSGGSYVAGSNIIKNRANKNSTETNSIEKSQDEEVSKKESDSNTSPKVTSIPSVNKTIPLDNNKFLSYRSKKSTSEYTPLDVSQSLFVSVYGNINVGIVIEHDETNSYVDVCDSFYSTIEKNYNANKEAYSKSVQIEYLDLNKFVKDFKCVDSKEGYEVTFSILYNSGYYKQFTLKQGENPLI